jgi:hypothetical protein
VILDCGIGKVFLDATAIAATNKAEKTTQTMATMHKIEPITAKPGAGAVPSGQNASGCRKPGRFQLSASGNRANAALIFDDWFSKLPLDSSKRTNAARKRSRDVVAQQAISVRKE